ncbi:chromatin assembly factor 1 subunit A-domain-containing protein [Phaeosphaeria sp. MPI-PUGE-AT-0046c]|nr:chromatin assembly factor 1 subunit A-domain-containing protein [Phaeosphaeria sp. MPI-PUGE-AT-0046c]
MMEDPTPVAPIPQKRPLEEDMEPTISTPVKVARSDTSSPLSVRSVQTPSPFKVNATPNTTAPASSAAQQPAKRRRLTQKEKDDMKLDKEAKAKARAEKKAQKDAEDKIKEEEKQKKADEREEKRRLKEEEQQQKEEEKAKKERSQMKLNAFFVKPKATGVSPGKVLVESSQKPTPLSAVSLSEPFEAVTDLAPPSPQKNIVKNAQSDYERYFLPFNIPAHTILAPKNPFMEDSAKMQAARTRLDKLIAQEDVAMEPIVLQTFKASFPSVTRRGLQTCSIVDIIERVNNSSDRPIDLTDDNTSNPTQPLELLKQIPMKYIHFGEDVRPPFYGTYTRSFTDLEASRLARNPAARLRQDTNYDYDSEAEWEEPEEGEDLDSEGDEDLEEDAEDDMDGFLDDEEDPQVKRRLVSGDLQPISTGLCWQDGHGVSRINDGSDAICTDFRDFSMGFLLQPELRSIDPFSTAYWTPEPSAIQKPTAASKDATSNGTMNPPRAPLAQRTMNGLLNTFNTPSQAPTATASKPVKAKRTIPIEHLPAFKAEIDGKDLTKIGMVEHLKKVFPKLPKDAITNTLSVAAARVGPTEKEKRWVLINT